MNFWTRAIRWMAVFLGQPSLSHLDPPRDLPPQHNIFLKTIQCWCCCCQEWKGESKAHLDRHAHIVCKILANGIYCWAGRTDWDCEEGLFNVGWFVGPGMLFCTTTTNNHSNNISHISGSHNHSFAWSHSLYQIDWTFLLTNPNVWGGGGWLWRLEHSSRSVLHSLPPSLSRNEWMKLYRLLGEFKEINPPFPITCGKSQVKGKFILESGGGFSLSIIISGIFNCFIMDRLLITILITIEFRPLW